MFKKFIRFIDKVLSDDEPDVSNEANDLIPDKQAQIIERAMKQTPVLTQRRLTLETLEFGDFPVLKEGKIKRDPNFNKNFITIKEKYIYAAFDALEPYFAYTCLLLNNDKGLISVVEYMLERMIAIYWDCPASRLHHDRSDFGLLKHSVRVAVHEAAKVSRTNFYSEFGTGLDTSKIRKRRDLITLCGFIIGLLHDSDKLLQIDLTCDYGNAQTTFSPLYKAGRILDFKLVHPPEKMTLKWNSNLKSSAIMGPMLLNWLLLGNETWRDFCENLSIQEITFMIDSLSNYQSSADHIAVRFSQEEDGYLNEIRIAISRMLKGGKSFNVKGGTIFKVSSNWYLLLHDVFFAALNKELMTAEDSVLKILIQNNLLFMPRGETNHKTTLNLTLFFPGQAGKKYNVSFCKSSFFETLPELEKKEVSPGKLLISRYHIDFLKKYGLDLPDSIFTEKPDDEEDEDEIVDDLYDDNQSAEKRHGQANNADKPDAQKKNTSTDSPTKRVKTKKAATNPESTDDGLKSGESIDTSTGEIIDEGQQPGPVKKADDSTKPAALTKKTSADTPAKQVKKSKASTSSESAVEDSESGGSVDPSTGEIIDQDPLQTDPVEKVDRPRKPAVHTQKSSADTPAKQVKKDKAATKPGSMAEGSESGKSVEPSTEEVIDEDQQPDGKHILTHIHKKSPKEQSDTDSAAISAKNEENRIAIKEIPEKYAGTIRNAYSVSFWNHLPLLQVALLESVANCIGGTTFSGIKLSNNHFQKYNDSRTTFYLLKNRTLLARTPDVIRIAWSVLLYQKSNGLYPWLDTISDFPSTLNARDMASITLINYFYRKWKFIGILQPRDNLPVFSLKDFEVSLIEKGTKVYHQKIDGDFIAFDAPGLEEHATHRLGIKSYIQVIRSYYQNLYKADFD